MNTPPDVAQAWMQHARSDLQLGRVALRARDVLPEDACFHAQQCAEKALKALLLRRDIPFLRTHNIEVLLDLLKANGVSIPNGVDEAFALSEYAIQTRYPGEWEPVTSRKHAGQLNKPGWSWPG
jgi:HEPN domain-containing protein